MAGLPCTIFYIIIFGVLCMLPGTLGADDRINARNSSTFTASFENDLFGMTDFGYTGGMRFTWISPDLSEYREISAEERWYTPMLQHLPVVNKAGNLKTVSLSLIHQVYTPRNMKSTRVIDDDRPYAGITQAAIGFHSRNAACMDTLEFDVGIVGPHSYGENVQKLLHEAFHCPMPMGWDNQLDDEPVFNLFFERKWRFSNLQLDNNLGIDMIPQAGIGVGNAFTGVNIGVQARFGWNLPRDFGTYIIRPGSDSNAPVQDSDPRISRRSDRFSTHFFAGLEGSAVVRDISLDGNTFFESHHVKKRPFVGDIAAGFGILFSRYKITYAQVYRTRTFEKQEKGQVFGSLTLSVSF